MLPHNRTLFSGTLLLLCMGHWSTSQAQPIDIGIMVPKSGPQANYGKDSENGARMAIEELNSRRIVINGRPAEFRLIVEESSADPKLNEAAAMRLCAAKVHGVIGGFASLASTEVSRVLEACKIPNIAPWTTQQVPPGPDFTTTFRIPTQNDAVGSGLASYASETMNLKKVAIVGDGSEYGRWLSESFKKAAASKGILIVDERQAGGTVANYAAAVASANDKTPDAIFYSGMEAGAGSVLQAMERFNMANVKYLGADVACSDKSVTASSAAQRIGQVVCAEPTNVAESRAWRARYGAKYPNALGLTSPYTYDAAMMLAGAMAKSGSSDAASYVPQLYSWSYPGVTNTIAFERNGLGKAAAVQLYSFDRGNKRQVAAVSSGEASSNPMNRTVTTYFATDRKQIAGAGPTKRFLSERGELVYGTATVNIPPDHRMGVLERPGWLRFWQGEDLQKHMVLVSADVTDKSSYFKSLNGSVDSEARRAFIFVHGYNVTFEVAALRTAQMAVDLQIRAVPVFYSWPSMGDPEQYSPDEQSAEWTELHLGQFLEAFATEAAVDEIFVIAHSMGARAATRALAGLLERRRDLRGRFKELVLAAPDMDAAVFRDQVLPRFAGLSKPVTLYVSSNDKALAMSVRKHKHIRAGLAGQGMVVDRSLETIDATAIDTDFLGHSYFVSTRPLLTDLALLIKDKMRAANRPTLSKASVGSLTYYQFKP